MYYLIALFNVIALYLAIKDNRSTWWFAILGTTTASIMFFEDMMFTSFLFNVYSTICSIIALFKWKKTENEMVFEYSHSLGIATCLLVTTIATMNIVIFNSNNVLFDSLGPTFAIVATFLLVERNAIAYLYWIACDLNYLICGIVSDTTHYIVIYTVMLILSIYGLYKNYAAELRLRDISVCI